MNIQIMQTFHITRRTPGAAYIVQNDDLTSEAEPTETDIEASIVMSDIDEDVEDDEEENIVEDCEDENAEGGEMARKRKRKRMSLSSHK